MTILVAALSVGGFMNSALGQEYNSGHRVGLAEGIDCTEMAIDYQYDPRLSDAENLALMERLFYQSLEKFDYCQTMRAAAANQDDGQAGGNGDGEGMIDDTATESQPGDVQGTRAAIAESGTGNKSTPSGLSGTQPVFDDSAAQPMTEPGLEASERMVSDHWPEKTVSTIPKDIPPADNDDMLATQIRQAAIEEPDPEVQARLWDEYRSYKGLPTTGALE